MNFMLPVPDASVPAVEICSDKSAAGIIFSANVTRLSPTIGSLLTTLPTAQISLMICLAMPGLHNNNQRRGVIPLVLFWNLSGNIS
uniref:CSON015428 protein n=1 Tax=Culicoides sonorensis TaxID=179676 RepID=A0A336LTZ7_CULSO